MLIKKPFKKGMGSSSAPAGAAAYIGPGDVKSGASSWFGLRSYSAAYATGSNPCCDLVDQAGANPITINILANGKLDVASINAWVTAHSVTTIKVTKMYDQVSTFHCTQATLANMPTLNLTAVAGTKPALVLNGSTSVMSSANTGSTFTVGSYSSIGNRTGNTSGFNGLFEYGAGGLGWGNATNTAMLFCGTVQTVGSIPDNAFHAMQGVANGASSLLYIDGTNNALGSPGTAIGPQYDIGLINGSFNLSGMFCEGGFWTAIFSAGDCSSLNTNQHTYWGF